MSRSTLALVPGFASRAAAVGFGYLLAEVIVGDLLAAIGVVSSEHQVSGASLLWPAIAALVLAVALAPVAAGIGASWFRHVAIWGALIFLNTASVLIEGTLFAPSLVPNPGALLFQQFVAAAMAAVLLAGFLGRPEPRQKLPLPERGLLSWAWRFALGAASYVIFYFVFGAINYQLITEPYYTAQGTRLVLPGIASLFLAEGIRGTLIVLSALPLLLTVGGSRRRLALLCGYLLFMVGGVVPLLLQARALPPFMLLASGWEIFLQNGATGAVVALLLGRYPGRWAAPKPSPMGLRGRRVGVDRTTSDVRPTALGTGTLAVASSAANRMTSSCLTVEERQKCR